MRHRARRAWPGPRTFAISIRCSCSTQRTGKYHAGRLAAQFHNATRRPDRKPGSRARGDKERNPRGGLITVLNHCGRATPGEAWPRLKLIYDLGELVKPCLALDPFRRTDRAFGKAQPRFCIVREQDGVIGGIQHDQMHANGLSLSHGRDIKSLLILLRESSAE